MPSATGSGVRSETAEPAPPQGQLGHRNDLWISLYVALLLAIFGTKFVALLAAHEQWREDIFYTAAVAATSSYREVLVAALISCLAAILWRAAHGRIAKTAVSLGAALCGLFMVLINLINAELLPYYGAPLSLDLIHASNVLATEHGRLAVLGWISRDAWWLVMLVLASPLLASLFVRLAIKVLDRRLLVAATVLFTGVVTASGALSRATPDVFAQSGTLHFLQSIRNFGRDYFREDLPPVEALPSKRLDAAVSLRQYSGGQNFKNVILVILESVGATYLDQYGGTYDLTPNLASLSDRSVVVERAYAQAVTSTRSMGILFSSRYPALSQETLPDASSAGYEPLPILLSRNGVRTGFFHSSDTRFDRTDLFLSRIGFQEIRDFRGRRCDEPLLDDGWGALATSDRCTFQELAQWIGKDSDRPFFATLWTFQSHYPYYWGRRRHFRVEAPPDGNRRTLEQKTRYLSSIAEADELIAGLVEALRGMGIEDETLLVITGDHGEAFGQRGTYGHRGLDEEVIRVPLILVNPRLSPGRSDRLTGHIDLAPTIADAFGLEHALSWDGQSLFHAQQEKPVYLTSLWAEPAIGYRYRDVKVVHRLTTGETEVFNVATDPTRSRNAAPGLSEQALETERNRLFNWAQKVNASWRRPADRQSRRGR